MSNATTADSFTFTPRDTVRGLVPIQIEGYAMPCDAGYQYTVKSINDDGTITIYRDEVAGTPHYATVPAHQLEQAHQVVNGTYYSSRTSRVVIDVLERVRTSGIRIRISHGYTDASRKEGKEVGLDWMDEHDVEGTISRSMGPTKIPILIPNSRSMGGGGLLDDCIVRIKETRTGRVLYQHPSYRLPELTLRELTASERRRTEFRKDSLTHEVLADGNVHARFCSGEQAQRFIYKFRN